MEKKKSSVVKIMRALHRDVGFLMVGIMVIYGISGLQLNLKGSDLFTYSAKTESKISPNLSVDAVASQLRMRDTSGVTTDGDIMSFSNGSTYNSSTGELVSIRNEVIWPIDRFNGLHKSGGTGITKAITTTSAVLLCFLAISSFWMYKSKNKNFKRGIILAIIGFAISVYILTFNQMGPPPDGGPDGHAGGPPQFQEGGGMPQGPQMPQGGMPGGH
jgi:hypothetical protein